MVDNLPDDLLKHGPFFVEEFRDQRSIRHRALVTGRRILVDPRIQLLNAYPRVAAEALRFRGNQDAASNPVLPAGEVSIASRTISAMSFT
jgi:hypothetical protein